MINYIRRYLLFMLLISPILKAQSDLQIRYSLINNIVQQLVKQNIDFYYLHEQPISLKSDVVLLDTLSKLIDFESFEIISHRINSYDSTILWEQPFLTNAQVINNNKGNEIISKNKHKAIAYNSRTKKPIKTEKFDIPIEEKQFYRFSIPYFNDRKDLALICLVEESGNYKCYRSYLFNFIENKWSQLIQLPGICMSWN